MFSSAELDHMVDPGTLQRVNPSWHFDSKRFARFNWLVVTESIPLTQTPGARAVPLLHSLNLNADFGRIEPHKRRFPAAVEDALVALLSAPWEEWTTVPNVDWRCFNVPWVYTIDHDDFIRPHMPPSADSLTWEPDFFEDDSGEFIETERPSRYPTNNSVAGASDWINEEAWIRLERARRSPLFRTPIAHFLVRAFVEAGIDEFIAFITTIDAALGLHADHRKPKGAPHPGLGAMRRMACRISALLGDKAEGAVLEDLYDTRSEYLHGRPMNDIPSAKRVAARKLARKVVAALVEAAMAEPAPTCRESYLANLLDRGTSMV